MSPHRNKDTNRDEFIFYSKRLIRLVIEYSLSLLPYESVSVATPQGLQYEGRRCSVKRICGVSILRYSYWGVYILCSKIFSCSMIS